jgi:hypothetical protein
LGYGLLDPYLRSIGSNFSRGVNFASSGSTARNTTVKGNGTSSSGLFSFSVQIDQYKTFKERVLLHEQSAFKGALTIDRIGSNRSCGIIILLVGELADRSGLWAIDLLSLRFQDL